MLVYLQAVYFYANILQKYEKNYNINNDKDMFFNIPLSLAFQLAKIIPACAEYVHSFPNNFKLWIARVPTPETTNQQ